MLNLPADGRDKPRKGKLQKAKIAKRQWRRGRRLPMNHSIYSADRTTHLKIVVVALVAAIVVAGVSILARTASDDSYQTARVVKAGKAVAITSSNTSMVR
jgi:hypothetical protein